MSGFAAIIAPSAAVPPGLLDGIAAQLAPIGPDRSSRWRDGDAALLHSLYAVSREDAGDAQPLTFDGAVWITGDIRVDGRRDLIAMLRQHGRDASAEQPDSALVLHAWHVWGEACAERLIGDFAFAIWDARAKRLFCARDQFGVCPLHYALADGMLIASNAVRAVRQHPGISETLDRRTMGDFLLIGFSDDRARGFFRDIQRLPPAHSLTFADGKFTVRRYWTPPAPDPNPKRRLAAEHIERFSAVFAEAVSDRIRSDKIALALSGGIDSPLVAAFAAKGSAALTGYTSGFNWLIPDRERHYAGLVAHHLGIPFRPHSNDEGFLHPAGGPWRIMPEPRFTLRYQSGHDLLDHALADGARMMLGGMGGDVLAAARPSRWADFAFGGRWLRLAGDWRAHTRHFGYRPPLRLSLRARLAGRRSAELSPMPDWIDPDFAIEQQLAERNAEIVHGHISTDPRVGMTEHAYWSELFVATGHEGTGLPLKIAHPFFDTRVLAEALALPVSPWLYDKAILRETAVPLLPERIVRRPKALAGGNPGFEGARQGIEPARQAIADCPAVEQFVSRKSIDGALNRIDRLTPLEYDRITVAASLAIWLSHLRDPKI